MTAKIRLGCTRDQINGDRSGPGGRSGRGRGPDGAWPHGAGLLQGHSRLGPDRRDQAAPEADSADRQRRSGFGREGGRGVPPLRRRWRDDRPGVAGPAVAVRPSGGGPAGRARPAGSHARGAAAVPAVALRAVLPPFRRGEGDAADAEVRLQLCPGQAGARFFRTYVAGVTTREDFLSVVERYFPREG